jgi:hypothetical protein
METVDPGRIPGVYSKSDPDDAWAQALQEGVKEGVASADLRRALEAQRAIIHVMGPQCGETVKEILDRKVADSRGAEVTLWAEHSRLAKPEQVRRLCTGGEAYLYLVADRRKVGIKFPGTNPAAEYRQATHYNAGDRSRDEWKPIADLKISKVTDSKRFLDHQRSYALVLGRIQLFEDPYPSIRMQEWTDVTGKAPVPVKTRMGAHAICAERKDMSDHPEVWIKERVIIAAAPIVKPFAVSLK